MKPVYISVDCEFTDGDLHRGQLMQVALVNIETEEAWSTLIPITSEARVNDWVRQNLSHLVGAALMASVGANHLQKLHVGDRTISGALARAANKVYEWVRGQQLAAYLNQDCPTDPAVDTAGIAADFPAVMVTYCGGYDFGFITQLFNRAGLESPFHYEMVDISPLALGLCPELQWGFTIAELEALLGMEPNERAHDALADAKHQAEMFRRLMAARSGALEALKQEKK